MAKPRYTNSGKKAAVKRARLVLFVGGLWGLIAPWSALAGSYDVRSCAASASKRSDAWAQTVRPGDQFVSGDECSGGGTNDAWLDYRDARWLRTFDGGSTILNANVGVAAAWTLSAPSGAALTSIAYRRQLYSADEHWAVRMRHLSAVVDDCVITFERPSCADLGGTTYLREVMLPQVPTLTLEIQCLASPCLYGVGPPSPNASQPSAAAVIYSSVVTVEENVAPTAGSLGVNGTVGGWLAPGATASLTGSDTLGLRRLEIVDASNGNAVVGTLTNTGCVDWSVLPCSESSVGLGPGFSGNAPIGTLGDGEHQLRARAVDAAGNTALGSATMVKVDRTAPVAEPTTPNKAVSAGTAAFAWNGPAAAQYAPITGGRLKICTGPNAGSLTCTWSGAVGASGTANVPLGNNGDITNVQVELTDEAGNVGLSGTVQLRRDTTAPAAPTLTVGGGTPAKAVVNVKTTDADVVAYDVHSCGPAGCVDSRQLPSGAVEVDIPTPGIYTTDIAAVDGAGNVGPTATASIDRRTPDPGEQPGPGPGPNGDGPPGTNDPPVTRTAIKLTVVKPIRPGIKRVRLRGTTQAGSTSRITVTVTARPTGRNRTVTKTTSTTPRASGGWTVSAVLPAGVPRGRKYTIKITATPTERFTGTSATFARRR